MQPLREQEKTKLWLSQYDNKPADRQLAEKLLDSISYCPSMRHLGLVRSLARPWRSGLFPWSFTHR